MGGRQRPHVENLTVRGATTVEVGGVVGGDAHTVVAGVLARAMPLAIDLIGLAHLVDAAALWDGLPERDDATASGDGAESERWLSAALRARTALPQQQDGGQPLTRSRQRPQRRTHDKSPSTHTCLGDRAPHLIGQVATRAISVALMVAGARHRTQALPHFSNPISPRYRRTPGCSCAGSTTALAVLRAVVSAACGKRAAMAAWPACTALARR